MKIRLEVSNEGPSEIDVEFMFGDTITAGEMAAQFFHGRPAREYWGLVFKYTESLQRMIPPSTELTKADLEAVDSFLWMLEHHIKIFEKEGAVGLPGKPTVRSRKKSDTASAGGLGNGDSITVDLGDGVNMELIWVEPGSFMMGSDDLFSDEQPVHRVTLTQGFWMGKYPVTQRQWQAVRVNNPSEFRKSGLDAPVENVSWLDCQEFIGELNAKAGGEGKFCLPTEAEWEYAARGGNRSRGYEYAGGNDIDSVGWYDDSSGGRTHTVGQLQANELGLYDMSGNVYEWCEDWYGDYPSGSVPDPLGPRSGSFRVNRGGSWYYLGRCCRSANRSRNSSSYRGSNLGFRLVRTAD